MPVVADAAGNTFAVASDLHAVPFYALCRFSTIWALSLAAYWDESNRLTGFVTDQVRTLAHPCVIVPVHRHGSSVEDPNDHRVSLRFARGPAAGRICGGTAAVATLARGDDAMLDRGEVVECAWFRGDEHAAGRPGGGSDLEVVGPAWSP